MDGPSDQRSSDEERDRAVQALREHFAAGRLTDEELSERVQAAYQARTADELQEILRDLPRRPASPDERRAELAERRGTLQRQLIQQTGGAFGLFLVCVVIWLLADAHHGRGAFWPVWVLIVPALFLVRNGWRLYGPAPELDRVEQELARRTGSDADRAARRELRRAERAERRGEARRRDEKA